MAPSLRSTFGASIAAFLIAACSGGGGSSSTPVVPPASSYTDPNVYSSAATASLSNPNEIAAVTQHQLVLNGVPLAYTATVGHLTAVALGSGAPRASFFYVAYTANGANPATRPVTFFYNGGPGSASVWLHLGSFGPKRLATGVPSNALPIPFELVDNAESLLDVTDLVFVDAVGSGLSQAIAPNQNRDFWGVDSDAAVFRDFVMRYVAVNGRAASPKFLFGESYGGPRTAVLADLLESAGMSLEGIVLQSPAMDYNSNCGIGTSSTISCAGYVPSYGASGAWLNRATPSPPPAQLPQYMVQVRDVAGNRYDPAVQAFLASNVAPPAPLLAELAATTGMPVPGWQGNFNLGPTFYRVNLIPGTLLGRYDARIVAPNNSINGQGDPSSDLVTNSFVFRIGIYLGELGYTNPSTYVTLGNAIQTWNFSHDGRALPDTIPDLASALAQNPNLKVLAVNGYHDLATPFFTTERDLARLGAPATTVQVRNYAGGHMTYLDDQSRREMKTDLVQFYGSALAN